MNDREFADEVIKRLNQLVAGSPEVAHAISQLITTRVNVSVMVADHPTLQINHLNDGVDDYYQLGLLGVLNGLAGVIETGPRKDWGFITAIYDDQTGALLRFERTVEQ